jgi:hypothetical protein
MIHEPSAAKRLDQVFRFLPLCFIALLGEPTRDDVAVVTAGRLSLLLC